MSSNDTVTNMFPNPQEKQIAELAEWVATEDDALGAISEELTRRGKELDLAKEQLCSLLMAAGLHSIKLESGLSPAVQINRKFYKASGVDDDRLFAFLKQHSLDGIIKPTVHFGTLQSTMREFEEQGNVLPPDVINAVDVRTVRMNGKTQYLSQKARKQ